MTTCRKCPLSHRFIQKSGEKHEVNNSMGNLPMLGCCTATKVHVFSPKWMADLMLTEQAVNTRPLKKSLPFALCLLVVITSVEICRLRPASVTRWGSCLPITSLFQQPRGGNESYSQPKERLSRAGLTGRYVLLGHVFLH